MVKLLVSHGANRQLRDEVSVTEVMRLCVSGRIIFFTHAIADKIILF